MVLAMKWTTPFVIWICQKCPVPMLICYTENCWSCFHPLLPTLSVEKGKSLKCRHSTTRFTVYGCILYGCILFGLLKSIFHMHVYFCPTRYFKEFFIFPVELATVKRRYKSMESIEQPVNLVSASSVDISLAFKQNLPKTLMLYVISMEKIVTTCGPTGDITVS